MNIIKKILIILFLSLSAIIFAQNSSELNCENDFETIETKLKSQEIVTYNVAYSRRLLTDKNSDFFEGIIVLSDLNDKINPNEIMETIARIGFEKKLSNIVAFRTCKAVVFFMRRTELNPEQEEYLADNLIAKLEIDLTNTLSKKNKKRNKKKRKLLQSLSIEACEEFKKQKLANLTFEQFNETLINVMVPNTKKIEKTYGKYIDEFLGEFTEDLIHELNKDCEIVKEFTLNFDENRE